MSDFAPGFVRSMSDETYHADPVPGGSLSSTFVRLLTSHVPAKARALADNRKPTKAMNLGKAAHRHALGAGPDLIVWEHDGRTKAGKAEREAAAPRLATEAAVAVTESERDRIVGMVAALRAHPEVVDVLTETESEVSAFWREGASWARARIDLLGAAQAWDYKTCEDSTLRAFSRAMSSYGYHQQDDWYRRGLRALGHPAGKRPVRFICQETTAPYLVQIHTADEEALEVARVLNDRAAGIYADCVATGEWPGYDQLTAPAASLPAYYFRDHEDELPEHLNPFASVEVSF